MELVHQQMAKPLLVMASQGVRPFKKLHRSQQKLTEVHHAFALALIVVGLVDLNELAVVAIGIVHLLRPQALLFRIVNKRLYLPGGELLVIHIHGLKQSLHSRELVLAIENLKR